MRIKGEMRHSDRLSACGCIGERRWEDCLPAALVDAAR